MSLPTEAIETGDLDWCGLSDTAPAGPAAAAIEARPMRFAARLHRNLADLSAVWTRLETEGCSTVYQRLDWLACVCEHLAGPARVTPLFVEVFDAATDETVLLLPLAATRRFGVAVVGWLDLGVCDYAAPLMAPGAVLSAEEAEQAWTAVLASLPGTDLVDLRQIPLEVAGVANPLASLRHCRPMGMQAFGLALEGDPKTLMRRLMGGKAHRDLVRRQSRMAERGPMSMVEAATEAEVATLFATMLDQRRRRFQKLGRFDLLSRPEVQAFYRDAALRSLRAGGPARLFGIRVGDQWVATAYMLVHAGAVHGIILSIGGEEWNHCAPGMIMAARVMEWSLQQGHVYFDMTVGNLPYKSDLGAQARMLHRHIEALTVLGGIGLRAITATSIVVAWVQRRPKLFRLIRTARQRMRRLADRSPT